MPTVDVECPECATVLPIEEDGLGAEIKCPKCKTLYLAEKSEGAYEVVAPPPRRSSRGPSSASAESEPLPETDAERKLRQKMERWAEE